MSTKIKLINKHPEVLELIPFPHLKEGEWFLLEIENGEPATLGVIVDGKPFYPGPIGHYRGGYTVNMYSGNVHRIKNLTVQVNCRSQAYEDENQVQG